MSECPCGSEIAFDDCCAPYIAGDKNAPTAEALMRSRYSAYAVANAAYLKKTLAKHVSDDEELSDEEIAKADWTALEIRGTEAGGEDDDIGVVEFTAFYTTKDGVDFIHRERSNFAREDGRWVYVDGVTTSNNQPVRVEKVGRNEPCPCGSGKKYKKCCGK